MTDYDIFYNKYITYKIKYLNLKKLVGGATFEEYHELVELIKGQQTDLSTFRNNLHQIDKFISTNKQELKKTKSQLHDSEKSLSKNKAENNELKIKQTKISSKSTQLSNLLKKEEEKLVQIEQTVANNKTELDKIISEKKITVPSNENIKKTINRPELGLSLDEKKNILSAFSNRNEIKAHVTQFKSTLDNYNNDITKITNQIKLIDTKITELETKISSYRTHIEELNAQYQKYIDDKNENNSNIKITEEELKNHQTMLKVLLDQMKKNPHMGNLPNPGYPGYPGYPGNVGYNNTAYPYPGSFGTHRLPTGMHLPREGQFSMGRSDRAQLNQYRKDINTQRVQSYNPNKQ